MISRCQERNARKTKPSVTTEQSGAFVELSELTPTAGGPLTGLGVAVKDLIEGAGKLTGCGNPTCRDTHPPAAVHAVCVEQLLAAGAHAIDKTVTHELAFCLIGENHFYGTPLNPASPRSRASRIVERLDLSRDLWISRIP